MKSVKTEIATCMLISAAMGALIASGMQPEMPGNEWWLLGKWWAVVILPAFVYGTFAAYGSSAYSK